MTEPQTADHCQSLADTVTEASANGTALVIQGGDSKRDLYGRHCDGRILKVAEHCGIVDYQPRELVLTARAGTRLTTIQDALAAEQQALAFEPPIFAGNATLGGTLACNLSGPARPFSGSIRDMVLGVQLINGQGEILNFGGKVMKNVAGYDVSRLQAGALGTLGVLSEISLKVVPLAQQQLTLCYDATAADAITLMNQRAAQPKPLTGAFWVDGKLYLRLAGAASAVEHTAQEWGGEQIHNAERLWEDLREQTLPFFAGDAALWRLSGSATTPASGAFGPMLIDWGGAQRWVRGEQNLNDMHSVAAGMGGHYCLVRGGDRNGEVRSSLSAVEQRLQQKLKTAFDPQGILNPGRLYSWM